MKRPQVFLCYARENREVVYDLYARLNAAGFRPWLDMEDLRPGQAWEKEIPKAIRSSDFALILFSVASTSKRGYVQKEMTLALNVLEEFPEDGVFILPAKIEECDVPDRFAHLHWVNLWENGAFEKLLNAMRYYSGAGIEASPGSLVIPVIRELLIRDALPRYELDRHYHFLDWNATFDRWVARPLGLQRGKHVEQFVLKCENYADMVYHAQQVFPSSVEPISDTEIIVVRTNECGRIVFVKVATKLANDQQPPTWRIQLFPVEAERIGGLLEIAG
jgi:hypothetical protein